MRLYFFIFLISVFGITIPSFAQIKNDSLLMNLDSIAINKLTKNDIITNNIKYYFNETEDDGPILNKFQIWKIRRKYHVNLIVLDFNKNNESKLELYNQEINQYMINKRKCKDFDQKLEFDVVMYILRNSLIKEKDFKEFNFFERINWRYFNIHSFNYTNYNQNN